MCARAAAGCSGDVTNRAPCRRPPLPLGGRSRPSRAARRRGRRHGIGPGFGRVAGRHSIGPASAARNCPGPDSAACRSLGSVGSRGADSAACRSPGSVGSRGAFGAAAAVTSTPEGSSTSQAPTADAAAGLGAKRTANRAPRRGLNRRPFGAAGGGAGAAASSARDTRRTAGPARSDRRGDAANNPTARRPFGADTAPRIVVRAKLDSWIQVRDGVARWLLVTRLCGAGETYEVPNQPSLSLLTGNAGGLEILVDGEPVPTIARSGPCAETWCWRPIG